jgi:hypothetical protein
MERPNTRIRLGEKNGGDEGKEESSHTHSRSHLLSLSFSGTFSNIFQVVDSTSSFNQIVIFFYVIMRSVLP